LACARHTPAARPGAAIGPGPIARRPLLRLRPANSGIGHHPPSSKVGTDGSHLPGPQISAGRTLGRGRELSVHNQYEFKRHNALCRWYSAIEAICPNVTACDLDVPAASRRLLRSPPSRRHGLRLLVSQTCLIPRAGTPDRRRRARRRRDARFRGIAARLNSARLKAAAGWKTALKCVQCAARLPLWSPGGA
jgi:hypothetical protein